MDYDSLHSLVEHEWPPPVEYGWLRTRAEQLDQAPDVRHEFLTDALVAGNLQQKQPVARSLRYLTL